MIHTLWQDFSIYLSIFSFRGMLFIVNAFVLLLFPLLIEI